MKTLSCLFQVLLSGSYLAIVAAVLFHSITSGEYVWPVIAVMLLPAWACIDAVGNAVADLFQPHNPVDTFS